MKLVLWQVFLRSSVGYHLNSKENITKTCLYNFDSLKPHFYAVKQGFTGVYVIFLISAQNIDCGYSLEPPRRGGSNEYPQSMFWAEIWKISELLIRKFSFFGGKIFSIFEQACFRNEKADVDLILSVPLIYFILLYKDLKGRSRIPTDGLIPPNMTNRNEHSLDFQGPFLWTDSYKSSYIPNTIRDWNALPASLISSTEATEDSITKVTSLIRSKYYSTLSLPGKCITKTRLFKYIEIFTSKNRKFSDKKILTLFIFLLKT